MKRGSGAAVTGKESQVISTEGWDGESDLTSGVWGFLTGLSYPCPSPDRKAVSLSMNCECFPSIEYPDEGRGFEFHIFHGLVFVSLS